MQDFLRLDQTGVFGADRTELLDGDIIIMNVEYRPHARVAGELGYLSRRALEAASTPLYVMGASITLSDHDMPLPDIVLTREPEGDGPIPSESVALIVEVSSATLQRDLDHKVAIYARAGVPEYWVADVNGRIIHQMWKPTGERYTEARALAFGEAITAATVDGLAIGTDDL